MIYINDNYLENYYIWIIENTNINVEKNIPLNLIEKYPYKWNYYKLSKNPNLTEEFILKYPYKKWDIWYLIENDKITNFNALTKFKNIDQYIIRKYPNKPWDWKWINKGIGFDYSYSAFIVAFGNLGYDLNLTEEYILKYPYQNWDIIYLIDNNKITNFKALSKFKCMNYFVIKKYPNKLWDWEWLIENTNIHVEKYISLDIIEKYSYKWDYWELSKNPNIIEKFILKYPYQYWDIEYLIGNNKITDFKMLNIMLINQNIKCLNKLWNKKFIYFNTDFQKIFYKLQ